MQSAAVAWEYALESQSMAEPSTDWGAETMQSHYWICWPTSAAALQEAYQASRTLVLLILYQLAPERDKAYPDPS